MLLARLGLRYLQAKARHFILQCLQIDGVQNILSQKSDIKSTWVPPEKFVEPQLNSIFNFSNFQQVVLLRFIFLALGFVGFML